MIRAAAFLLILLACSPAAAQSAPYVHEKTVGTSSAQVIIANTARKRIMFINPNDTAKVAVCPTISRVNSAALTCTVNGAGSITLLPYAAFGVDNVAGGNLPTAWNAIASAGGSALTILEWE